MDVSFWGATIGPAVVGFTGVLAGHRAGLTIQRPPPPRTLAVWNGSKAAVTVGGWQLKFGSWLPTHSRVASKVLSDVPQHWLFSSVKWR